MMNKQTTQRVEAGLQSLYHGPNPDAAFVKKLEAQLRTRYTESTPPIRARFMLRLPRWAAIALLLLLCSTLAIVALGPQRVWAALQGWISFVPGVGFTDVDTVRVLETPVTASTDTLALYITDVTVEKHTRVTFVVRGLPKMDPVVSKRIIDLAGINPRLRLSNGDILTPTQTFRVPQPQMYQVTGEAMFPRVPEHIMTATLELVADSAIATLPLPAGGLSATLTLLPASDEAVAEQFPEPHVLENVSSHHHGITMTVKRAVYGGERLALDVEFQNASPWYLIGGWPDSLLDDTFKHYTPMYEPMSVQRPYHDPKGRVDMTFTFEPSLRPGAESLTLAVNRLAVYTNSAPLPITFTLDMGAELYVPNQAWPLDIAFEVADIPYHIVQARLKDEKTYWNPEDTETKYFLEIDFAANSARSGDVQRNALVVESSHEAFTTVSYSNEARPEGNFDVVTLGFRELPQGELTIRIPTVHLWLQAPWRVTWDVAP